MLSPQNQTSAPFGSCLNTPMSNLHPFPCLCLSLRVGSPTSLQGIPGRKDLNRTSQRSPTQKVNVIATVCTALSDLGPCCPSDPTSRYCPPLCLPSDREEAPSCPALQPTRHAPPSPWLTLLPVDVHVLHPVRSLRECHRLRGFPRLSLIKSNSSSQHQAYTHSHAPYTIFILL